MLKVIMCLGLSLIWTEMALADEKKSDGGDAFTAIMSTKHDFSEVSINGQMKAPDGFFLRGRETQRMSQMVRLRSNFKKKHRSSRSAIKATHR